MRKFLKTKIGMFVGSLASVMACIGFMIMLVGACWADGSFELTVIHFIIAMAFFFPMAFIKLLFYIEEQFKD